MDLEQLVKLSIVVPLTISAHATILAIATYKLRGIVIEIEEENEKEAIRAYLAEKFPEQESALGRRVHEGSYCITEATIGERRYEIELTPLPNNFSRTFIGLAPRYRPRAHYRLPAQEH